MHARCGVVSFGGSGGTAGGVDCVLLLERAGGGGEASGTGPRQGRLRVSAAWGVCALAVRDVCVCAI